jgi:hypothetical protein
MTNRNRRKTFVLWIHLPILFLAASGCIRAENVARPVLRAGTVLRVHADAPVVLSRLQPGEVLAGTLREPAYSRLSEVVPAGAAVRVVVGGIQAEGPRQRAIKRLVRVFSRARRSYSVDVTSATIRHPNGEELPF